MAEEANAVEERQAAMARRGMDIGAAEHLYKHILEGPRGEHVSYGELARFFLNLRSGSGKRVWRDALGGSCFAFLGYSTH